MNKKTFWGLGVGVCILILIAFFVSPHTKGIATQTDVSGVSSDYYISFKNDSLVDFPQGKTSVVMIPEKSIGFEITLFSPEDPKDARVEIKNKSTGASCATDNYLVDHVLLSKDESTLLIYNYSGSNSYLDAVDTKTCKPVAAHTVLDITEVPRTSFSCPDTLHGQPLYGVGVYDGIPSELASLIPEDSGWKNLDKHGFGSDRSYVVCEYSDTTNIALQAGYELPASFTQCLFHGKGNVICK